MNSKLIIALDNLEINHALNLASLLSGHVWGFKVNDLLLKHGTQLIPWLGVHGNVFADAKLHDIPRTVGHGVHHLADMGADIISVHLAAGEAALETALNNSGKSKIFGVSVLTSLSDRECNGIYQQDRKRLVQRMALEASTLGLPGIVCAAEELPLLENRRYLASQG